MKKILIAILLALALSIAARIGHAEQQRTTQSALNESAKVFAQLYAKLLLQDMTWIALYSPRSVDEYLDRLSKFKWKTEGSNDIEKSIPEIAMNGGDCDDFTLYAIALAALWTSEATELGFVMAILDDPDCKVDCGHITPVLYHKPTKQITILEYIQGGKIGVFTFQGWKEFVKNTIMQDRRGKPIFCQVWYLLRDDKDQPPIESL